MVFQPARYCDLPYGNVSRFSPVTDLGAAFNKSLKQKSAPLRQFCLALFVRYHEH